MTQFDERATGAMASIGLVPDLTDEQIHLARLQLARAAADEAELRCWLDMLGIGPENGNEEAA